MRAEEFHGFGRQRNQRKEEEKKEEEERGVKKLSPPEQSQQIHLSLCPRPRSDAGWSE